ncbi:MAG TPA: 50S ribosomal protein L11 methyltransferase [Thermoanaerobaculia bacterium]|nr:50S ribosomal protein L11 methyltransferase [Thermoanaerobaculia bacterium]
MARMAYLRRTLVVPAGLEELVVGRLWAAGTLGVEIESGSDGSVRLAAWFPVDAEPVALPPEIQLLVEEPILDADWLAAWRERSRPFPLGASFFVAPREPDVEPVEVPAGRRLLRLPARAAFGTGSHESTRLAVELLEEVDLAGRRVLDVGTGTGILAFASLALGAAAATAFDLDPAAPFHARDNARLNGFHLHLFAGTVAALRESARFDLAVANLVPEELLPELAAVARRLAPRGEVILSGILEERGGEVLERGAALGLAERARRGVGEWVAFRLAREGGA